MKSKSRNGEMENNNDPHKPMRPQTSFLKLGGATKLHHMKYRHARAAALIPRTKSNYIL